MLLLRTSIFLIPLLFSFGLGAQDSSSVDTSLVLQTIVVRDSRLSVFDMGRKQQNFAPATLAKVSTVGQLLEENSLIHLKNYGPAQLSTASMRGGSASHTAVLWNGLNIDNTMLGLMDFSLLPTALFEEVSIRYGGESTFWGSGAISGSVHLNSTLAVGSPSALQLFQRFNTIGTKETGVSGKLSGKNSSHALRLWYQASPNDFSYTNDFGESRRLSNADYRSRAILQENRFRLGKNEWVDFHVWIQDAHRSIPPTKSEASSDARQIDEALRIFSQWKKIEERTSWELRLAFIDETNDYIDPSADIYSENQIQTTLAQGAFTKKLFDKHLFQTHVQARFPSVNSNNFSAPYSENQWGISMSYKIESLIKNWNLMAGLRQEWNGPLASPFLMSVDLQGELSKSWEMNARFSKNYRFPTFNDRFWNPGGVPDLLPEQGWSQELGVKGKAGGWTFEMTAFSRIIDNWIIWLPTGSFFSPKNIQQVWSRGLESRLKLDLPMGEKNWSFSLSHDYVRSTNQKERFRGDATKGKQLIYVPLHKGALGTSFTSGPWQFSYRHAITGTVYSLPDHSQGLSPFQIGKLGIQYAWRVGKIKGHAQVNVENLWDEDYELVENRAMPGRFVQTGIQIKFK